MPNPPARLLRGQIPKSYLNMSPTGASICNPNRRHCCCAISCCVESKHEPKLLLRAFDRCVLFFFFFVSPRGAKRSFFFLRKCPGHTAVNAQRRILRLQNHSAPGGVYSHYYIITDGTSSNETKTSK